LPLKAALDVPGGFGVADEEDEEDEEPLEDEAMDESEEAE